jgi:hypothetical protein
MPLHSIVPIHQTPTPTPKRALLLNGMQKAAAAESFLSFLRVIPILILSVSVSTSLVLSETSCQFNPSTAALLHCFLTPRRAAAVNKKRVALHRRISAIHCRSNLQSYRSNKEQSTYCLFFFFF